MAVGLTIKLKQGDNVIAERTATPTATLFTEEWTLTAGERAKITDWTNLNLEFEPTGTGGAVRITQAYLDLPKSNRRRMFSLFPVRRGATVNTIRDSKHG